MIFTIRLENLHFFGRHGVLAQERKIGAEFIVDISLDVEVSNPGADALEVTVSYAAVYEKIALRMKEPSQLLETLAWDMSQIIISTWDNVKGGSVKITKTSPPIPGILGRSSVEYKF